MTKQNPKIDGRTKRALDMAIARKQVSQESYRAVLAGRISLQEAKAIGRGGTPAMDATQGRSGPGRAQEIPGRASTGGAHAPQERQRLCLCGCGQPVSRTFKAGHDTRLRSELAAQIKKGDVLLRSERITPEQRAFAVRHGVIAEGALPPDTEEEK